MKFQTLLLSLILLMTNAQAASVGTMAPDFTLPDASGKSFTLSSLRGQFVYVDFWASWCAPCRRSLPWMNQLSARTHNVALELVAINVDEHRSDADAFLQQLPLDFTVVYDPVGKVAASYKLPGMPTSFLIDPEGRVRWIHIGFRPGDDQKAEQVILSEMRSYYAQKR